MIKNEQKRRREPVVMSMVNDQCVWGRAGVIKSVKCINAFDCLGCSMDQQVLANFEKKRSAAGQTDHKNPRMMLLMSQGKCRHMLSGRISYGLCSYGYNCAKCPFDQMIEDTSYLPNIRPPAVDATSGFNVARDHYYHFGHSWARVEYGGRVRIGIDDFAMRLMGPQDEIEVPGLGSTVGQNRPNAVLKRDGKEAPTLSPVDGTVIAVNHNVINKTATANKDPYGEGWLMVIQPSSLRNNLKNLFFGTESLAWIDDEFFKLQKVMGDVFGEDVQHRMAATGGEAISDIYGEVPEIGWDRLVTEFLHSK
jgi:glycine cleavage system H lipoate-binding protein